jgi:parallel beta-helix repeat protein
MKGKLLAIFFCFILASAWMSQATSSVRWVAKSGADNLDGANDCLDESLPCETITQAIARANPGDKITVKGGQFKCEEAFPITIATQPLMIEATSAATIEATGCNVPEGESIILIKASNSAFINFTIKGGNSGNIGIKVEGASNVEIGKITLESVGTGILLSNSSQITLGGSNAEKIEIKEPTEVGIKLKASAGNTITHTVITQASKGIVLEGSHWNQLLGNTVENSREGGIEVWDSNENDILTNTITQPDQDSIAVEHGIFLSSQGATRGNVLVGNTVSGFMVGIALESIDTGIFE